MKTLDVTIPVSTVETVSGVLEIPAGFTARRTPALAIAHGAGNDMHNPLLVHFSQGLCRQGFLCLRFNFPYKEQGRSAPDPQEKLVQTWKDAFEFLQSHPQFPPASIVVAGKSMGGRVASQMASEGLLPASALVFLGYPLHPPGKKEQLRDAHLYRVSVPMLFFAGTRDPLCDLDLLKPVVGRLNAPAVLEVVEGGDHSFNVPKKLQVTEEEIYDRILERTLAWLKQTL